MKTNTSLITANCHRTAFTAVMDWGNKQLLVLASLTVLLLATSAPLRAQGNQGNPGILPPKSHPYGKTYGEWSAKWWKWAMELPVPGHPFIDDPSFQISTGQSGQVWFLGAPLGTVQRTVTIPAGKALFVGLLNAEASDLEGLGTTEAQQRDNAKLFADHILNLFCTIDGVAVEKITTYRFVSSQFTFTAPTPWIFGATGRTGKSVSDGYFLMLAPLSAGPRTIHFGGGFHFSIAEGDDFYFDASIDMIYYLTVQ